MRFMIVVVLLGLTLLAPAHAHYIWVEREADGAAKVRFGEWHRGIVEKTGGRLDNIQAAIVLPDSLKVSAERRPDHIRLATTHQGDLAVVEPMAPRAMRQATSVTRTTFMARAGRSEVKSLLELDLVPDAPGSNRFTLLFRGEPLARTRLTVYGPPRWEKSLATDQDGRVEVETPWAGQYLVEVNHVVEEGGEVADVSFDASRYNLVLSFSVDEGARWSEAD
ncbi:DUF4198 domain-containing protein [Ectothiorhodospira variabilis]|uniref:DUF4198 domain-containing protein n=1 Tax=Ectothiorhodospira variabilis TaxID=505694 RepID=UPI001EFC0AD9|nr:DUF4198 domain-containing protein [Ectothiorhodospira variabilis]MCG5496670.1 DUF4198 domain-containing protein [Ectothiorhodospira variabilis]